MKRLLLLLIPLFVFTTTSAFANVIPVQNYFTPDTKPGKTITGMFQSFELPKFSTSAIGGLEQHVQIQYIDDIQYDFVYFQLDKVCVANFGHPCTMKYKVEVTYQDHVGGVNVLHDGFLSDYGYPGDEISWSYIETGGNGASVEIFNSGDSGHGSWDHNGTWTWSGPHPVGYQEPHFTFNITKDFGTTNNCLGDMPAQDTPGSPSHVSTLDYLGVVTLSDGSQISMPLHVPNPTVTTVSPTNCGIGITTFWDGYYTNYEMTSYGGG